MSEPQFGMYTDDHGFEQDIANFEYGVEHVYAGHYHGNAYGRDGALAMVTTGPVGSPLGPEGSGFRIVTVRNGGFDSKYYGFQFLPNLVVPSIATSVEH